MTKVQVLDIRCHHLLETFSNFYHSLRMRWQDTSSSFVIFGLRLDFIKFKNTFHARGSACSDTNTVKISREALHTASTYSKYHEYHFFESPDSIISCTCSSNLELPEKIKETEKINGI